ncbi:hypothetical protein PPTG_16219 [Phytophthora nicotianae INRA-310]|uniref:SAM domain-containing protein n=1 Tax=Phytophthora nicotianae (strain INRA-310) TaxID=761204 RepID=W2PRH2_PHYN3|nr:hypothetical protein PPTG_16219 [Phytophthora nicotianae INRA-310]ETN02610.1 hypothetical protein PPTG_16219 [Phytophthora nicotianae INRA-310]
MSATTQELENDIAQMEDRLANVKVVVEVEREAWRRSSGKNGTKWKGAAAPRNKENETTSSSEDMDEGVTIMPGYWDSLELAHYLQDKQLGSYAQVVVNEQITGKMLLETPAPKLRKLFETSANDSSWKDFQTEFVKLKKHQRRLEKACATNRSQPGSSRSVDSSLEANDRQPSSSVMSSAGAALVFPLISPLAPATTSSQPQQNIAKPPTASKHTFLLRKPASSNNIPLATCWNCKARFFRPHIKRPIARASTSDTPQPVSSSMRASLLARAYCSQTCRESIEASDIRISPSLSARVKVTFNTSTEETTKPRRPSRVVTGRALSSVGDQPAPEMLTRSDSITASRLGGSTDGSESTCPPPKTKRLRKFNTFTRRTSRPDASLDDLNSFDFLHVAAPRREPVAQASTSPQQKSTEYHPPVATFYENRNVARSIDANVSDSFALCPSVTSIAINAHRSSDAQSCPTSGKPLPPALLLSNPALLAAPNQCKVYQQSKYKLDPDLFQAHQETFSSCFGAMPLNNRSQTLTSGYGRGNFLRLQEFLTVRGLHRLSLTSHAWYDMITTPSAFSDAIWGAQVLRMWRPREEDEDFLHEIGVLKKPERPRRMLQILTRQVFRITVENMKILLNPESWQLAAVMSPSDSENIRPVHKVVGTKRVSTVTCDEGELSPRRQRTAELYEQITVIYTRGGEIVAVSARQLIKPVDPTAMLTDILHGLKREELSRVHCRRLRLFSQTNRLPFDQWMLLPHCSRAVVEFFWSDGGTEATVCPPLVLPAWHQKTLSKLQHGLQQRLLGKDSVNCVIKAAHDENASAAVLLSLEKFLTRCHA